MSDIKSQPIVLVVAMESERVHVDQLIPGWQNVWGSVWPTLRTLYRGVPLILVRSGIGMVAAAAATEYALLTWTPRCLLNFGCAGAHTREILPGDVIIGTGLVSHGRMRISPDEGIVPMDIPFTVAGEPEPRSELRTSPGLVALAQDAARKTVLDLLPAHPGNGAVRVHSGVIASADVWMQDPTWLDATHQRTGSLCEDMEAAAIAQVAMLHDVPFLTIKDISNNEFHATSPFEGTESALPLSEVGKRAAVLTVATIDRIIASSD
ncbi:MAG TPA: 5'-methylthioadenosine/S-adenosylhomocysteine nucleosidase [Thermomicrobiales bacterium]|nr:5'-methylthioadenosine/S-adenosylhomocysteine nucleosidase [Thermomicrobiales bacterium]